MMISNFTNIIFGTRKKLFYSHYLNMWFNDYMNEVGSKVRLDEARNLDNLNCLIVYLNNLNYLNGQIDPISVF